MSEWSLNEYRFFDADPKIRKTAFALYSEVRGLPLVCPHGHVDPSIFAENKPFPDPAELIIIPDHYIFRMLYSQGVPLESLGVPTRDGTEVETDHRKIWQRFAEHFYLFAGTPTGVWLSHELVEVFGVKEKLNGDNAQKAYDQISERLASPEYLPRELFKKFNIEVLTTTDGASDTLEHHKKINASGWDGKIIPCFRPDAAFNVASPGWREEVRKLSVTSGLEIDSYDSFLSAIKKQREFFAGMGAVSTDQGVETPFTGELSPAALSSIFLKASYGEANKEDQRIFIGHMMMEMARMSIEDGMVMQIHAGSMRDHNKQIYERFGSDKGCDIPITTEWTRNLKRLLNKYGNNSDLTVILFTLDETNYTRELAPLAGHYPALRLGPAWWFHDSIEGMTRYRHQMTETAGIYNTVGFNDDTRAFPSIPARHDLARRIDCNFLAGLVERHIISMEEAKVLAYQTAYGLVKKAYKL